MAGRTVGAGGGGILPADMFLEFLCVVTLIALRIEELPPPPPPPHPFSFFFFSCFVFVHY